MWQIVLQCLLERHFWIFIDSSFLQHDIFLCTAELSLLIQTFCILHYCSVFTCNFMFIDDLIWCKNILVFKKWGDKITVLFLYIFILLVYVYLAFVYLVPVETRKRLQSKWQWSYVHFESSARKVFLIDCHY